MATIVPDQDLAHVIDLASRADVVGIGEHAHGELTSWKFRLSIVKGLRDLGKRVVVLSEHTESSVQNMNLPGRGVPYRRGAHRFQPSIMFDADKSVEHLEITRAFKAMSGVEYYGIDVQVLGFLWMWKRVREGPVRNILKRYLKIWRSHKRRNTPESRSGALRNTLNARVIRAFVRTFRRTPEGKTAVFVYFAHNEHIALSCHNTREDTTYVTEGPFLAAPPLRFLSIATYAPVQWSLWGSALGVEPTLKTDGNRAAVAAVTTKLHRRFAVRPRRASPVLDLMHYNSDDFDFVLCELRGARPTLLTGAVQK